MSLATAILSRLSLGLCCAVLFPGCICSDPGASALDTVIVHLEPDSAGIYSVVTGELVVIEEMSGQPDWFGVVADSFGATDAGSITITLENGASSTTELPDGASASIGVLCDEAGPCTALRFEIAVERPSELPLDLEIGGVLYDDDACNPSGVIEIVLD